MSRFIRSDHPDKPVIRKALKAKSKGTKVTVITEVAPGIYEGHCFKKKPGQREWTPLGLVQVVKGVNF